MAFKNTDNAVLTDSQSELTSKIGSMRSLLSLPSFKRRNIPRNQQISTYDYLMKILRSIGITPEIVIQFFVDKVFSLAENFLENVIIEAMAAALDAKKIKLSSNQTNANVMKSAIPANFLVTVKLKIAQELTYMIFGPRNGNAAQYLVPDSDRRNFLIDEAICGGNMFSLSNDPTIRNEDISFNRIKLAQQLEKGEVIFEINCQDVKIKLPDDPSIFFGSGGVNTVSSSPVTPSKSLDLLVSYVENRTQQINNQQNSKQVGKGFREILVEKLLSYITTLVIPYMGPIFAFLKTKEATKNLTPENTLYGACAIEASPDSSETQAFAKNLTNSLYKELVKGLLIYAIKNFKKLVASYFAKSALEKAKRKADKIKLKFKIFKGGEDVQGAAKQKKALKSLDGILGKPEDSDNSNT